jgi:deoxyadenosine/deoxycytidine kinase
MRPRHVAIEGPIGVGKTELARRLARRFEALLVLEPDDNPFLGAFYADRRGAAFSAQVWFLLARHRQLKEVRQGDLFHSGVVSDYLFEKDRIFAHLNLNDDELDTYERLYGVLAPDILQPDLVVYLQAKVKALSDRIAARGRSVERRISDGYLREVTKAYDNFFFRFDRAPLLVVDTNDINPAREDAHFEDLVERISAMHRGGVEYYKPG